MSEYICERINSNPPPKNEAAPGWLLANHPYNRCHRIAVGRGTRPGYEGRPTGASDPPAERSDGQWTVVTAFWVRLSAASRCPGQANPVSRKPLCGGP